MTKTKRFTYAMGRAANFVWTKIFDPTKVDPTECADADCLHRDYGTPMTAHCAVCHDSIFKYKRQLGNPEVQQALKDICGKCEMPPVADPEMPPAFPEYVEPTELASSQPDTFEVYRQGVLDRAAAEKAKKEAEATNPQPASTKTPEEIAK